MKHMPILTERMAPMVAQASRRAREADDEVVVPRSKRVCVAASVEVGECFGPGTPTKEAARKGCRGWDCLELGLLERVTRSLSAADLCSLAQVNKHYQEVCSRDALWAWRAAELGMVKAGENDNLREKLKAAVTGTLSVAPLESFTNLRFSGDVTIVDPFCLFFQGKANSSKHAGLRKVVREFGYDDLVLTYRGVQCAVLRTSCVIHDDDTAFEVFRGGQEIGANVTTSGVIAVVPKRLVLKLVEENGGVPEEVRGVTVSGVDGILRCSSDGDFIIRQFRDPHFRTGEADFEDILCSTGGSWTEDTDSDDEEEELTDEEMAEAVAEVAKLSNSFSNVQHFHCNGEGLIHKFTNFEVSMLS